MKLRVLKMLLFVVASTLDVSVRAESSPFVQLLSQENVTEQPDGCLSQFLSTCGFMTSRERKFLYKSKDSHVTLGPSTSIVRESNTKFNLLSGLLLVQPKESIQIVVPSASVVLARGGTYLIERQNGITSVKVLDGEAVLEAVGRTEEPLVVRSGFQNWVSGVNEKGQASVGVVSSLLIKSTLETWAQLFEGTRLQFRKTAMSFVTSWKVAIEESSEINRNLVERALASEAEKSARDEARRRAQLVERRKMREWFYRKSFEE